MSLIGNIIWLIFGGFFAGLGYIIGGLALCLTIVGIPFGLQSIQLGISTLTPFGKEVQDNTENSGFLRLVFDAIWLIFFGWEIALAHLIGGAILAITIVGLPFARHHFKLIPVSLFPFHYQLN